MRGPPIFTQTRAAFPASIPPIFSATSSSINILYIYTQNTFYIDIVGSKATQVARVWEGRAIYVDYVTYAIHKGYANCVKFRE